MVVSKTSKGLLPKSQKCSNRIYLCRAVQGCSKEISFQTLVLFLFACFKGLGHTHSARGFTPDSVPKHYFWCSGNHMKCWMSNLVLPCARQIPFPLYCHSAPTSSPVHKSGKWFLKNGSAKKCLRCCSDRIVGRTLPCM